MIWWFYLILLKHCLFLGQAIFFESCYIVDLELGVLIIVVIFP